MLLKKVFFNQPTEKVARGLLGTYLIHESPEGRTVGQIIETEAYLSNDPACHASRGMTARTEPMFGPPGHAYIYFIYGMYHCFNVVTAPVGIGEAVLIRAIKPIDGIDLMKKRRPKSNEKNLCNGPGKLVLALGIQPDQNRVNLLKGNLRLETAEKISQSQIEITPRIGISQAQDLLLRFLLRR